MIPINILNTAVRRATRRGERVFVIETDFGAKVSLDGRSIDPATILLSIGPTGKLRIGS